MSYEFPIWQASREYICPPDADPAWREAYNAGADMAAIEDNLKLSPEERLQKHDQIRTDFLKREEFFDAMQRGQDFMRKMESRAANRNFKI